MQLVPSTITINHALVAKRLHLSKTISLDSIPTIIPIIPLLDTHHPPPPYLTLNAGTTSQALFRISSISSGFGVRL